MNSKGRPRVPWREPDLHRLYQQGLCGGGQAQGGPHHQDGGQDVSQD